MRAVHLQELRDRVREALSATPSPGAGCAAGQTQTSTAFVTNFYVSALLRQPSASELSVWTNNLRAAGGQSQGAVLSVAQQLGQTLFTSAEYAARGRSDRDYVRDLYKAYLQREPDQGGWDNWTQTVGTNGREYVRNGFAYSTEFAQVVSRVCPANASSSGGQSVPRDGAANLAYDASTNHVTTAGYAYDAAGNQTHVVNGYGTGQRYVYDAANRLVQVNDENGSYLAAYTYGSGNERLISDEGGYRTYYAWSGEAVIAEYGETSSVLAWTKSYVFLGARLLATLQPNGAGGETTQFHHPDRLGTRLITNAADSNYFEQVSLPYGTALDAESSGATNRRFTSYDRSASTGLDYAVNRHYDPQQGRFTQADPLGMGASSLADPQSLNMYAYCGGDPVNRTDPSGLFWGKLFRGIMKILSNKWVQLAIMVALVVISGGNPGAFALREAAKHTGRVIAGWVLSGALAAGQLASHLQGQQKSNPDDAEVIKIQVNGCANGNPFPFCGSGGTISDPFSLPPVGSPDFFGIFRHRLASRAAASQPRRSQATFLERFTKCYEGNHVSRLLDSYPRVRTLAEFVEVGSELSLAGDLAAMSAKAAKPGALGTTNPYASGLNYLFRRGADAIGNPAIGGVTLKYGLQKVGSKVLTPALAVPGAFSAGYNLSTAVQCGAGVIQ